VDHYSNRPRKWSRNYNLNFFLYDGDISCPRGNLSWIGKWNTDRGVLTVSFEGSTINGTYDYKVKN
tara:strand:+ start:3279 stop:3476 length:198 start_codon:yes stop_codon:yes gene_type:complete